MHIDYLRDTSPNLGPSRCFGLQLPSLEELKLEDWKIADVKVVAKAGQEGLKLITEFNKGNLIEMSQFPQYLETCVLVCVATLKCKGNVCRLVVCRCEHYSTYCCCQFIFFQLAEKEMKQAS